MKSKLSFVVLCIVLSSFSATCEQNATTERNEMTSTAKVEVIDDAVRQLLLRAIDKLQNEESDDGILEDKRLQVSNEEPPLPSINDDIRRVMGNSHIPPRVQYFTATFDEKFSQEQPLTSFIDDRKTEKRQRINEISSENKNEIKFKITKAKGKLISNTTATSTTTTPRPTHNEDGENIEIVDKKDIKIQAAPLLTAFTVDVDPNGNPNKIIPIIHETSTATPNIKETPTIGATIMRLNVYPGGVLPTPLPFTNINHETPTDTVQFKTTVSPEPNSVISIPSPLKTNLATQQNQANSEYPLLNDYIIKRQQSLEQQVLQLQHQANQQREQFEKQLRILQEQYQQEQLRFKGFASQINVPQNNPLVQPTPNVNNGFTTHPSAGVQQDFLLKGAGRQLNINANNPNTNHNLFTPASSLIIDQHLQPPFPQQLQHHSSSFQIQPSNGFSLPPHANPPPITKPLELSPFQTLPQQSTYPNYQDLPFLNNNENFIQHQQKQQPSNTIRNARQEFGTNFNHEQRSHNPVFFNQPAAYTNGNRALIPFASINEYPYRQF